MASIEDKRPAITQLDITVAKLAGAVWLAYAAIVLARALVAEGVSPDTTMYRLVAMASGLIITIGMWCIIRLVRGSSALEIFKRAAIISSVGCAAHVLFNEASYQIIGVVRHRPVSSPVLVDFITIYFGYLWIFITWAALCSVVVASAEDRRRDKAVADARVAAQQAQLASLRYQIQPHFLFNALNAISSLIGDNRTAEAEVALLKLSSFYRHTLMSAPNEYVRLGAEIDAQRLYLAIEEVRFPDRLNVEFAVSPETSSALVPSLILQPFVENAVKHGLARSLGITTIRIAAERRGDRLCIVVLDDARASGPPALGGLGSSLENVRKRLEIHYDLDFALTHLAGDEGGWVVTVDLPFEVEDRQ